MTPVRVSDLKPQYPTRTVLLCRVCGDEWSACREDYSFHPPDYVMKCHDQPMSLVTKKVVYEEVSA